MNDSGKMTPMQALAQIADGNGLSKTDMQDLAALAYNNAQRDAHLAPREVSDTDVDRIAKMVADHVGNGMREKYIDLTYRIIESLSVSKVADDWRIEHFNRALEFAKELGFSGITGALTELGALLAQGHVGVREGWKLVPVEPTERMLHVGIPWFAAWQHRRKGDKESTLAEAYKNMLDTAPAYDDGGK